MMNVIFLSYINFNDTHIYFVLLADDHENSMEMENEDEHSFK